MLNDTVIVKVVDDNDYSIVAVAEPVKTVDVYCSYLNLNLWWTYR